MSGAPIWLLDVDGVLNAVQAEPPEGYKRTRCGIYAIIYNPTIIARITALHEAGTVEVRWLTTWCEDAAEVLAPAIGLPAFTVEGTTDHLSVHGNVWWKSVTAQRVSDREPDRALIWTDDDLEDAESKGEVDWLRHRTAGTLALSCDWRTGLTAASLDRIEAFCDRQLVVEDTAVTTRKEQR